MPVRKGENRKDVPTFKKDKRLVPKKEEAFIKRQDLDTAPKTSVEPHPRVRANCNSGKKKKPK